MPHQPEPGGSGQNGVPMLPAGPEQPRAVVRLSKEQIKKERARKKRAAQAHGNPGEEDPEANGQMSQPPLSQEVAGRGAPGDQCGLSQGEDPNE